MLGAGVPAQIWAGRTSTVRLNNKEPHDSHLSLPRASSSIRKSFLCAAMDDDAPASKHLPCVSLVVVLVAGRRRRHRSPLSPPAFLTSKSEPVVAAPRGGDCSSGRRSRTHRLAVATCRGHSPVPLADWMVAAKISC